MLMKWALQRDTDWLKDRYFQSFEDLFNCLPWMSLRGDASREVFPFSRPDVFLSEDDKNWYVEAIIPGMESKDLQVSVEGQTVRIKGTHPREEERKTQ